MNICYVVADGVTEYNSSNFRVSVIADALRRAGHTVYVLNVRHWMAQTPYAKQILADSDIIHLQRVLLNETHEHILQWRKRGKAVVADWDDSYDRILDSNAAADFWLHGMVDVRLTDHIVYKKRLDEHPINQFRKGLELCTAGITPSKILSKDWERHAPCFVVPNYLDTQLYRAARKHDNSPYTVIGWGGSLSHTQSFENSGVQEALQQILSERPNVRLLIVGDDRIVEQLPVRKDRLWFSPYTAWQQWQKTLARYDIGLAPLSGDYDDRRSSLKVAEYTMFGIPFVATASPVYEDFFECSSGKFALHGDDDEGYDSRVESWYQGTIDILDDMEYYSSEALDNIVVHGMRYDADANVNSVIGVYQEIIDLV